MRTLLRFSEFVQKITNSQSRKHKETVLAEYANDEAVKYYLNFIFNPFITTGIAEKKVDIRFHSNLCIDSYPQNIFESAKNALEYIRENNTGSNNDLNLMFSFYMSLRIFDIQLKLNGQEIPDAFTTHTLFEKILTKNLQLGIDAKTINKVIPNCIPVFNVMLANKYFDNPEIVTGREFVLTTKIDGGRIIALKENGKVTFYTRQGQIYSGLVDLEKELTEASSIDNVCFDGEITLLCANGLPSKTCYKETMKITRKDGEKHGVKMLVFDVMPAEVFRDNKMWVPYAERRELLQHIFNENKLTFFECLPVLYRGTDISKISELLATATSSGEEGLMLNFVDEQYEFKRSNALLKIKTMKEVDLRVIGFDEGTNKYAGKLGALLVSYKNNTVKVGSGFSDDLRETIWKNKEDWLNKIIAVQYFEETINANGLVSLRFPVFVDIRTDKNNADY